jgi:uncharacterized membrane protein YqhA
LPACDQKDHATVPQSHGVFYDKPGLSFGSCWQAGRALCVYNGRNAKRGGRLNDIPENKADSEKEFFIARKVAGRTRFVATVPAMALLVASVVLALGTFVALIISSVEYVTGAMSLHDLTIEYVEYADAFLLAVALYILSIGFVNLFISENIPLPKWLKFYDFDDLKERLTGVIVVMIGVFFLGHVLKGAQGIDTLWIGLGCAAVVVALSFFMGTAFKPRD